MKKWLGKAEAWIRRVGGLISAVLAIIGAASGIAYYIYGHSDGRVPAWVLGLAIALGLVLIAAAFFIGRRSYRRLPHGVAERARDELGVARGYLAHVTNFMSGLRETTTRGDLEPAAIVRRLEDLRDLVFDAIIQGINTAPGEHIRCALFEPFDHEGETCFRVRRHRGHTHRVEHLRLDATSVAGRAFFEKRVIYVPDAETNPAVQRTEAGRPVRTLLCLPSYSFWSSQEGKPSGVFSVASNHQDAFSPSDRAFITACADVVSLLEMFVDAFEHMRSSQAPAVEGQSSVLSPGAEQLPRASDPQEE